MNKENEAALMNFYSNEILDILDHREDYTRGDLQGVIEAIVLNLLRNNHERAMQEKLSWK